MAISVVCPGCKKRFKVSDQFGGRKGPCPNCKTVITIPEKGPEIVIHGADEAQGTEAAVRRKIIQPVFREDLLFGWMDYVGLTATVVGWIVGILAVRMTWPAPTVATIANPNPAEVGSAVPWWTLALGAILIAIPSAVFGYRFLRDRDRGGAPSEQLSIRMAATAVGLPLIWVLPTLLRYTLDFQADQPLEIYYAVALGPIMLALATAIPWLAYEMQGGRALVIGGLYLMLTLASRMAVGLTPFG